MPEHLQPTIKPIHVNVDIAAAITGESRSRIYEAIQHGELTAYQAGARTLVAYAELEARCAARPIGLRKEDPALAAARDAALRKKEARRKRTGGRRQ